MKKTKRKRAGAEKVSRGAEPAQTVERDEDVSGTAEAEVSEPADAKPEAETESPEAVAEPADVLEALEAKVAKLEESLLRARADCQNVQRRSVIERSDAIRYANAELMRSLLGVVDDFERSLVASEETDNQPALVDGIRLVYNSLLKAMREHGMEAIEALHRPFDPSIHEAIMQQPAAGHPPGTVVEEIAKGYRLYDRVIRPSKVIVSRAPDEAAADSKGADEAEPSEAKSKERD